MTNKESEHFAFCTDAPGGQIHRCWGLLSTNRSKKILTVGTTIWPSTRSFANDLAPPLLIRRMHQLGSGPCRACVREDIGSSNSPTASNCASSRRGTSASSPSRRDSDLEAFSHNPSDGAVASHHWLISQVYEPNIWICSFSLIEDNYCRSNTSSIFVILSFDLSNSA